MKLLTTKSGFSYPLLVVEFEFAEFFLESVFLDFLCCFEFLDFIEGAELRQKYSFRFLSKEAFECCDDSLYFYFRPQVFFSFTFSLSVDKNAEIYFFAYS